MGQRHARVLAALEERFALVGTFDVRAGVRAAAAPVLASEEEAIDRADLVVVATPNHAHAPTVVRALERGRHVLVEKPLCARARDAEALVAAASAGSSHLFVGHSERFNPVVRVIARLVRTEGVVAIDLSRVGPSRPTDCGVLLNLAVHDLDLAAYLGGGSATVRGSVGRASVRASGEDAAHVLLSLASGGIGHVHVDRTVPERSRTIVVATPRWIYEGDLLTHRLVRMCRESGARTEVPLPIDEPLVAQATALADALDGGTPREIALAVDGARAVALAEAAALACSTAGPLSQPAGFRALPR
jgi:predicted dehydrogenase